jgi:hypothetical protein
MFLRQANHRAGMPDRGKLPLDERGEPLSSRLWWQVGEGLGDLQIGGDPFAGAREGAPDWFGCAGLRWRSFWFALLPAVDRLSR